MDDATVWKSLLLVFLFVNACMGGNNPNTDETEKTTMDRENKLIQLITRVHHSNLSSEQKTISENWDIEANKDQYSDPFAAENFLVSWKSNVLLPREQVFSLLHDVQVEQAIALFDLFYFAKNFDTLYKTACWARANVNADMFVYAIHLAVLHRDDTQHIALPPVYETMAHLFVDARTVQRAMEAQMQANEVSGEDSTTIRLLPNPIFKPSNASLNPEYEMALYTEDLDLNAFYVYFHLRYPFWMSSQRYGKDVDRYGELFLHVHKQILARYNLQRLSAGLPETEPLSFDEPIKNGYSPRLRYPDGSEVPSRPDDTEIVENHHFDKSSIMNYERRVQDAIDLGYVIAKNTSLVALNEETGPDVLGKIFAGGLSSINIFYYGFIYRKWRSIISHSTDPNERHGIAPGVTEHFASVLRDPAFYQAWTRIENIYRQYEERMVRYESNKLGFPGVRIENVDVDNLTTYFDYFDVNLENVIAVRSTNHEKNVNIFARIERLNHRPFAFNISVASDRDAALMVRVFLGPKKDAAGNTMSLNQLRRFMVEMDRFPTTVKPGKNTISRQSIKSTFTKEDLNDDHGDPHQGNGTHRGRRIHRNNYCGFPQHLLLPKVSNPNVPLVLFVMVTPYEGPMEVPDAFASCGTGFDVKYPDSYAMGFPFDRPINDWEFYTPNMYFKDVHITHVKSDS